MAEVTVKSGNISAHCDESNVIFRSASGDEIKWPFNDWEPLATMVREKKYAVEEKKRKNKAVLETRPY